MNFRTQQGIGTVEVVVASAMLTLVLVGVLTTYQYLVRSSGRAVRATQAELLLTEGLEVARLLRDDGWVLLGGLSTATDYGLTFNGTSWETTPSIVAIDGTLYRTLRVADVFRDGTGAIVSSGGTYDADTKQVTVAVSWNELGTTTVRTRDTYLTNVFE